MYEQHNLAPDREQARLFHRIHGATSRVYLRADGSSDRLPQSWMAIISGQEPAMRRAKLLPGLYSAMPFTKSMLYVPLCSQRTTK